MSFSFSKEAIEELKSQIDIVDVIGRSVQLKRAGSNYKGLCPFHNEKTPSFIVSPQKQIFTCFGGCGASGDAVSFVMRYYNLEFGEAVQKLADEYGITIQQTSYDDGREKYYEINREAARFFYKNMTESRNAGYTYMRRRGIEDRTIKKFGLGFAPDGWDNLYNYFKEKNVDEKILVELGLLSEKDGRFYDKFRNRVIFPIINTAGKVIGFGGRAISDEMMPKYLNSPENRVFRKKNNLYALNLTRRDMGKEKKAIIVEGYMDVISLYQSGVRNVSASLGTALTENQAKLIGRYTKDVILSYDADAAGQKAALRGIEVLKSEGCKVKVLHVTDGKDPDEYIKKNGREAFLKLVDSAVPYTDYKIENCKKNSDLSREDGKIDFVKNVSAILRELTPLEREIYIEKISRDTGIPAGAIKMEIEGNNRNDRPRFERPQSQRAESREDHSLLTIEANVLKCLFAEPELSEEIVTCGDIFKSKMGRRIIDIIFELYGLKGDFNIDDVTDRLDPQESESLKNVLDKIVITGNEKTVLMECISKWKTEMYIEKEKHLQEMLLLAEESGNKESANELMMKLMEVQKEMERHRRELK